MGTHRSYQAGSSAEVGLIFIPRQSMLHQIRPASRLSTDAQLNSGSQGMYAPLGLLNDPTKKQLTICAAT